MRSKIFQVLMLSLVLTTYAFGQDKKNEPPKTGRIIIGGPNQNIPTTPSGTKEDPSLKAKRREQMYQRKVSREVSKANAGQTANAVAAAGSQMVGQVVQRANDQRVLQQRMLNQVAGRQSNGAVTSGEIGSIGIGSIGRSSFKEEDDDDDSRPSRKTYSPANNATNTKENEILTKRLSTLEKQVGKSSNSSASKIHLWECRYCKRQHQSEYQPNFQETCPKIPFGFGSRQRHSWDRKDN